MAYNSEGQLIMAKFSPSIFLKSAPTRRYFVKKLRSNVGCALKRNQIAFRYIQTLSDRLLLQSDASETCIKILKKIFGIYSVAIAHKYFFQDIEDLALISRDLFSGKDGTFAIECSRSGKHSFTSKDAEVFVGADVVKTYGLKVNLSKPDYRLHIDIENDKALFYFNELKCFGGLPLGVEGNVAVLFEGDKNKIESAICAWLMMRKGCNVFPVTGSNAGNIGNALEILSQWNLWRNFKVTNFADIDCLINEEGISALVVPERKISKTNFCGQFLLDSNIKIPIFRPLLLMSKAGMANLEKILLGKTEKVGYTAYI
ncbi:MAG: THUMP domain-containing protein [Candidatus Diapherotrites archaeon]|nr:THUMP domain-containing protein [Candidatus Diapherotrites archaeon]